jgi:hypothetical protein
MSQNYRQNINAAKNHPLYKISPLVYKSNPICGKLEKTHQKLMSNFPRQGNNTAIVESIQLMAASPEELERALTEPIYAYSQMYESYVRQKTAKR